MGRSRAEHCTVLSVDALSLSVLVKSRFYESYIAAPN